MRSETLKIIGISSSLITIVILSLSMALPWSYFSHSFVVGGVTTEYSLFYFWTFVVCSSESFICGGLTNSRWRSNYDAAPLRRVYDDTMAMIVLSLTITLGLMIVLVIRKRIDTSFSRSFYVALIGSLFGLLNVLLLVICVSYVGFRLPKTRRGCEEMDPSSLYCKRMFGKGMIGQEEYGGGSIGWIVAMMAIPSAMITTMVFMWMKNEREGSNKQQKQ
eukprot:TRINITY_DN10985_c0_g1_i1.p1 TRINITY_DN10985_c0_g1~~TRINITY_DN10985_c0_g1_i1.p1  ORF type:complete len:219 (+),score=38.32 TRINITY_DN10985_c0_g1_i1:145-801(+)